MTLPNEPDADISTLPERTVGVIGGLGPEATLDFFAKVLVHSKARSDQEHIRLVIGNNPKVPNRNDAIAGRGPSSGPALAETAQSLERAGVDFMVMACNTAHAFEPDIRAGISTPFVSLIDEVVNEVRSLHAGTAVVGVLAAQGCIDAGLYSHGFACHGIKVLLLDRPEQDRFMTMMYRIKSGDTGTEVRSAIRAMGESLIARGASVLVAGCTEVPLVLKVGDTSKPLIDSTDVLARRTVEYARNLRPLPTHAPEARQKL